MKISQDKHLPQKLVSLTLTVLNDCILTTNALTVLLMNVFCSSRLEISVLTACNSCHTHTYSVETQAHTMSEVKEMQSDQQV